LRCGIDWALVGFQLVLNAPVLASTSVIVTVKGACTPSTSAVHWKVAPSAGLVRSAGPAGACRRSAPRPPRTRSSTPAPPPGTPATRPGSGRRRSPFRARPRPDLAGRQAEDQEHAGQQSDVDQRGAAATPDQVLLAWGAGATCPVAGGGASGTWFIPPLRSAGACAFRRHDPRCFSDRAKALVRGRPCRQRLGATIPTSVAAGRCRSGDGHAWRIRIVPPGTWRSTPAAHGQAAAGGSGPAGGAPLRRPCVATATEVSKAPIGRLRPPVGHSTASLAIASASRSPLEPLPACSVAWFSSSSTRELAVFRYGATRACASADRA
jgi:hypothetical protein